MVVVLRGIFGPRRQRQRGDPVDNFTTLDDVLAEAERMPDIVNRRVSPVDTSLPDVPEEPEEDTKDLVVVVMPDSSMHLGRGEDVSARAVGTPAVAAALKISPGDTSGGSSAPAVAVAAAVAQSAGDGEPVHSRNDSADASSSSDSAVSNPASQTGQPTGCATQTHTASQSACVEAVGTSVGERGRRSSGTSDMTQAAVELTRVQQQTSRHNEGVSKGIGDGEAAVEPCTGANAEAGPAASTSAAWSLPADGCVYLQENLQDGSSSIHTGQGSAGPSTPASQCEQGID